MTDLAASGWAVRMRSILPDSGRPQGSLPPDMGADPGTRALPWRETLLQVCHYGCGPTRVSIFDQLRPPCVDCGVNAVKDPMTDLAAFWGQCGFRNHPVHAATAGCGGMPAIMGCASPGASAVQLHENSCVFAIAGADSDCPRVDIRSATLRQPRDNPGQERGISPGAGCRLVARPERKR